MKLAEWIVWCLCLWGWAWVVDVVALIAVYLSLGDRVPDNERPTAQGWARMVGGELYRWPRHAKPLYVAIRDMLKAKWRV